MGADGVVGIQIVKVYGIRPGMIENPVQDDMDTTIFGFLAKLPKIGFRSQHGIDFMVISRIVAVIAARFEDGVQIDPANPQFA